MSMLSWIEELIDPIVKKTTKKASGMSDDEYDEAKKKGKSYLESGSTGDSNLDDYMKDHIPDNVPGIINGINEIGKSGDWLKDQVEGLTGAGANKENREIADQNLQFEKEKFDYDKALQQEIFQREDTAYQRSVNDMRLAGLNPLNMQSANGAGEAIATTAPQNGYQAQQINSLGVLETIFNSALQAKMNSSNASLNSAQANLLNTQADSQRIKNTYEASILQAQLNGMHYDNTAKWYNNEDLLRETLFNQMMGWTKNMPDWLKLNSAKFDYMPLNFKGNSRQDFQNVLSNPGQYWFNKVNKDISLFPDISLNLLSDELLSGTLGVFGSLGKILMGK